MKDDQLRIPFPDYPAAEQEWDARISERKKQTDVYVMKVKAHGADICRAGVAL